MPEQILLVDDQHEVLEYLSDMLSSKGFEVLTESDSRKAMERFQAASDELAIVILDLDLGADRPDGLHLLKQMKEAAPGVPIIMLTGKGTTQSAVEAIKLGATDFLEKDLYIEEHLEASMEKMRKLLDVIQEVKRLRRENRDLKREADLYHAILRDKYKLVWKSEVFGDIVERCRRVASIPRPVLIRGERGTGKELAAATIHYSGNRAKKPFVTINCAAFSGTLLESEMFGHERGAFTGADKPRQGRFEMADGGTLFLDEVGNMPMDFQEKILRIIEYQSFERVGGNQRITVDVRFIAATNAKLEEMMEEGSFRSDLYDRLAFETIELPPLRERPDDIAVLVEHFAANFADEVSTPSPRFSDEALEALQGYHWPGNVRELRNLVERLCYTVRAETVELQDIPLNVREAPRAPATDFKERVAEYERRLLLEALEATGFNQKEAARRAGLTYDQLRHYYRKYDFEKP